MSTAPSNIDNLIDTLEIVADWRDDLQRRIDRGQLILETVGLSAERQDELLREGEAFKRVCHHLAERVPGSLTASKGRRAA